MDGWFLSVQRSDLTCVVLFLPLYLKDQKHIAEAQTILIPAFFAGGMLLFSNFAGRLGDRYGHLLLMRILGLDDTISISACDPDEDGSNERVIIDDKNERRAAFVRLRRLF